MPLPGIYKVVSEFGYYDGTEDADKPDQTSQRPYDSIPDEETDETDSQCKICLTNKIRVVIKICGHVLCKHCINNLPKKECPICRKPFDYRFDIIRLYL